MVVVGRGGGIVFFLHRKSILSCFGPQHSKKWCFFFFFLGGGVGGYCFFFMKETMQSNVFCLRKQHDARDQASNHQASG